MAVKMIRRAEFFFKGHKMVAIEVSSGAIEIYRVEEGWLEMFKGYVQSPEIPGSLKIRAIQALFAAGSEHVTYAAPVQMELAF